MKRSRVSVTILLCLLCISCNEDLLTQLQAKIDRDRENSFISFRFSMTLNPGCAVDAEGAIGADEVTVLIPVNTDVTSLIAEFEFNGKEVVVGETVQESGVTPNDFTESVLYTVRSLDGTSREYQIVVRESSDNAELSSLAVERGAAGVYEPFLEPVFSTGVTEYIYWVPNTVAYVVVSAETVDGNASAAVNGTSVGAGGSADVSLTDGPNDVEIVVTAEDGLVTRTYTIRVYRAVGIPRTYTGYASSLYNDDGSLMMGVPWDKETRFTDNGDGTVLDTLTGLLWLKHPVEDISNGYTWGDALDKIQDLENGENDLSDGSVRGDWRMPNYYELFSLFCAELDDPGSWLDFRGFTDYSTMDYRFWTSTSYTVTPNSYAYSENTDSGIFGFKSKEGAAPYGSITAVRGPVQQGAVGIPKTGQIYSYPVGGEGDDGYFRKGVPFPSPRFIDNGDGTVTDRLTGLIWLQDWSLLSEAGTYSQAMSSIDDLQDNGTTLTDGSENGDWRMPNIRELISLADFSCAGFYDYLVTELGIFDGILSASNRYWSSTNQGANSNIVYILDIYELGIEIVTTGSGGIYWTAIRSIE